MDRASRASGSSIPVTRASRATRRATPRRWPRARCSTPRASVCRRARASRSRSGRGCRSRAAKVAARPRRWRARSRPTRCWARRSTAPALLEACLVAEETVAGRHLDNIAPSLLGGIVLIRCMEPLDVVQLPVPDELMVVLVRPEQPMRTAEARAVLPRDGVARRRAAPGGAGRRASWRRSPLGDYALLGRAIDDRIAEPARAGLLPGLRRGQGGGARGGRARAARSRAADPRRSRSRAGATARERVAAAMVAAYAARRQRSEARVAPVDRVGAPADRARREAAP